MVYTAAQAKKSLEDMVWKEGEVMTVSEGPYRFRVVVHCSAQGRQKTLFQNGEHSYFSYVQLLASDGSWNRQGTTMVPILHDGRFLMVLEQRAPQGLYDNPSIARIGGEDIDLRQFGPYSSLEFPGGAVDPGEGLKAAIFRELAEETGVKEQQATYYARLRPCYSQGSDLALQQFVGVVFLSGGAYSKKVNTDGGLRVFALTMEDMVQNLRRGVLRCYSAAIAPWAFYKEVEEARASEALLQEMISDGYMSVEQVKIALPK